MKIEFGWDIRKILKMKKKEFLKNNLITTLSLLSLFLRLNLSASCREDY